MITSRFCGGSVHFNCVFCPSIPLLSVLTSEAFKHRCIQTATTVIIDTASKDSLNKGNDSTKKKKN